MAMLMLVLLGLVYSVQSQTSDCTTNESDESALTQFIFTFGKALKLTEDEKIAIGFTVFNRVADPNFPNSTAEVVNWEAVRRGKSRKYYNKLAKANLVNRWNQAKDGNTDEYQDALQTSRDVLCGEETDPTMGATDFSIQETPRFFHAPRSLKPVDPPTQIGKLYLFKLVPKVGKRRGGGTGGRRGQGRGQGRGGRRRGGAARVDADSDNDE